MPSRVISITTDVYEKLNKIRLKNESFSQAINRLLESHTKIIELAGAWKQIPDVEPAIEIIEKTVRKIHEEKEKIKLI